MVIRRIDAKVKLSQNRPDADIDIDIDGVVAGLRDAGDERSAAAVPDHRPPRK